jgi:hypothetical protein
MLGYSREEAQRIVLRFRDYDERELVRNSRHRNDLEKLIELSVQGRRDIAQLLAEEAQSAAQIDQDDTRADEQRGGGEAAGQRL